MLMLTLVGLLVLCAAGYVALSVWARRERRQLGLQRGRIEAADDSRLGSATLRSEQLGLVARPDHVLDVGGMRIPVEQKPSAQRVWRSHALQVAAQCALLEETAGVRPTHGVVVLANAQQEQVAFTPELERDLTDTMQRMREILESGESPGPRWSRGKCAGCGYRQICWGSELASGSAEPRPAGS
jgi:CRISPR-associated exonuclease Cas4